MGAELNAYVSRGILVCPCVGGREALNRSRHRVSTSLAGRPRPRATGGRASCSGGELGSGWDLGTLGIAPGLVQHGKEQPLLSNPQLLRMPPSLLPSRSWRAWGSPAFSTVLAAELERAEAPPCPTEKSQQRGRPPWPQAPAGWAGRLEQSELVNPVPSPLIPCPPDSREEVTGVASADYPDFQGQGLAHSSRGHNMTFCFKKVDPSLLDPKREIAVTLPLGEQLAFALCSTYQEM